MAPVKHCKRHVMLVQIACVDWSGHAKIAVERGRSQTSDECFGPFLCFKRQIVVAHEKVMRAVRVRLAEQIFVDPEHFALHAAVLEPPPFHRQPLHDTLDHVIHIFPRFLIVVDAVSCIVSKVQDVLDRAAGVYAAR
jgi:hypothetical protein